MRAQKLPEPLPRWLHTTGVDNFELDWKERCGEMASASPIIKNSVPWPDMLGLQLTTPPLSAECHDHLQHRHQVDLSQDLQSASEVKETNTRQVAAATFTIESSVPWME